MNHQYFLEIETFVICLAGSSPFNWHTGWCHWLKNCDSRIDEIGNLSIGKFDGIP